MKVHEEVNKPLESCFKTSAAERGVTICDSQV